MDSIEYQRLKALFEQLIELPASERSAWLDSQGITPSTRERLRALFAADDALEGMTARSALDDAAEVASGAAWVGRRVGAFVIERELGQGGMGSVFLAQRSDGMVAQRVAVKLIRPERLDENTLARFRLERQVLALLSHPNIATLLDVGELEDGTPYVVMELVDGQPITAYVRDHALDLRQRLRLFIIVCDAVGYANRNHIVHRDLKPSNILVTPQGVPKLLDFGIAKPLQERLGVVDVVETRTTTRFFSPHNAAPEQVRGEPVTSACDVYALGVLLYELLTGAVPFEGTGKTPGELELAICEAQPLAPSARLATHRPSATPAHGNSFAWKARTLRGDLDSIVLRCLRKHAGERYASVADLAEDVERFLRGKPVVARRGVRRRRMVWRVVVSLALMGAFAFVRWVLPTLPGERRESVAPTMEPTSWPKPDKVTMSRDESLTSRWGEAEKNRFSSALRGHRCDTMVVPVQNQGNGFDRVTRSLMTAELALALGNHQGRCVVDPYWLARALGDGVRRYDEHAVRQFAADLGVRTLVWTYVRHDNHSKMDVYVRTESHGLVMDGGEKAWVGVEFSDERPPFLIWQDMLPEVTKAVRLEVSPQPPLPSDVAPLPLPDAPNQLVKSVASPIEAARRYVLLAGLAPAGDFRATERLHEKAWLAAQSATETAEVRRLRARSLFHLGFRPAALAMLKGDDATEALLLQALLDGNLPEARAAETALSEEGEKLVASLEVRDLALTYQVESSQQQPPSWQQLAARSSGWRTLLQARADDLDDWHVGDSRALGTLLDEEYPVAGYSVEEVVRSQTALGETPNQVDIDLLPTRHLDHLIESHPEKFCCAPLSLTPSEFDYVDLLSARAMANLEKRLDNMTHVQGQAEQSLSLLDQYDVEFAGHPHFSVRRAKALWLLLTTRQDAYWNERGREMTTLVRSAAYNEQGATLTSSSALEFPDAPRALLVAYGLDFPPKPFWRWTDPKRTLLYSTNVIQPVQSLYAMTGDDSRRLMRDALGRRFHGARALDELRLTVGGTRPADDVGSLRAQLAQAPDSWDLRAQLANSLIQHTDYAGATEILLQYPGFKSDPVQSSARAARRAYEFGSLLYWRGAITEARALYDIAASHDDGSEAGMLAHQRLFLIEADYANATQTAMARIKRYQSPYAYRDYLGMLFARREIKDAWSVFGKIAARFDGAGGKEVWVAALFGQRIEGASAQQVSDWLTGESIRSLRIEEDTPALWFGTISFLIDRPPNPELAEVLAKVEGAPATRIDVGDYLQRPLPGKKWFRTIPRSAFHAVQREKSEPGQAVASQFVLFARGYEQMRAGDHAAAVTSFVHLADFYSIEGAGSGFGDIQFVLPYFAFSAAKTGDFVALKPFLDALPQAQRGPEFHLAQAYFAGLAEHVDEALAQLQEAFVKLDSRLISLSAFQYAETCVRLFEETHDARFRELALDWARKYQRLDPVMAWSYALEARYGDAKDARHLRAVALAYYLDRNSYWLGGVAPADIERAKAWLNQNNPFLRQPKAPRETKGAE